MRNPDTIFMYHNVPNGMAAKPISFRNDYLGINQDVYQYDEVGKPTHVSPKLKREVKEFAQTWFATLNDQGFWGDQAVRTILSP